MDYSRLKEEFKEMEKKGKVDTEVIQDIEELKRDNEEKLKRTYQEGEERKDKDFLFRTFFALKTQLDILSSMKSRIKQAKASGDNPTAAEDCISMIDKMKELKKTEDIDLSQVLKLQQEAIEKDLFPDSSELTERQAGTQVTDRFIDNLRNEMNTPES